MTTFLIICLSLLVVLLIVVSAVQPPHDPLSLFELKRRAGAKQAGARARLRRERLLPRIRSLLAIKQSLLLVAVAFVSVPLLGWGWGVVATVLIALLHGLVSQLSFVRRVASWLYAQVESSYIRLAGRLPKSFRAVAVDPVDEYRRIDSRQELEQIIARSEAVFSDDEKKLIEHSLGFSARKVKTVMTPRADIKSIKKSEFLGPLVLSELHDLGHSCLPVIHGDLDHVVGILHLRDLLSLDIKRSVTAEKAMSTKVYYIREDQSLQHALVAFLKTHYHLFVVINKAGETVGLLTLNSTVEALIGRELIDQFESHDNRRAVTNRDLAENLADD